MLGFRGGLPSKDALSRAKTAALKAIELDDSLAEPHASLAFIAETYEWDWATAEREYKRALELNPSDAQAHNWYAGYLTYVGRFDDGIAEAKRARDLDPLSLPMNNALAGRLLAGSHYDEALRQVQETLELDSHFAPAHQTLGWVYLRTRKAGGGHSRVSIWRLNSPERRTRIFSWTWGSPMPCWAGQMRQEEYSRELENLHEQGIVPSGSVAILYGALGESNEAFAWLEKAYAEQRSSTYIPQSRTQIRATA